MAVPAPVRIGLRVAQYGARWDALRDQALLAEARGFHTLWVNDHLRTPGRLGDLPAFDAFSALAALAPTVRSARLGVAVLSASYRPPALAAKMCTALDVISGGRLTIGLGTGSDRDEHDAYGFPFGSPRERAEGLEAAHTVMRELFAHPEGANLPGALADAPNVPPPVQTPPPIWIAANRPRLLRWAGANADGLVTAFTDPDGVRERLEVARNAAAESQRRRFSCALYTYVLPYDSPAAAHAWLAPEAAALGTDPERLVRWLGSTGLVGGAPELRERIADFAAAGVTDLILVLPNRVPPEAIDALADAVLPRSAAAEASSPDISARANLCDLLVESHRRAGRGADPALIADGERISFDALAGRASRAAGALEARGLRRGDRLVIALRDGADWASAALGAWWLGAVAVPIDPEADDERVAEIVADCEPHLVVREPDDVEGRSGVIGPVDLADGPMRQPAAVHPEDLAYLIYSSGSTGRPKAAMHAHADPAVSVATYTRQILGLAPGDRCLAVPRLFTSFGFGNGFFRVLGAGATAVLTATRPNVRTALRTIAEEDVTVLSGVPTFWSQMVRFLARHPDPGALAGVRLAVSSGDSLPAPIADALVETTGVTLTEGLGCSECSNTFISWRPGEHLPGVLGRPIDGVEVRLADEDGRPVVPGEPGRLWIKSDSNTTGYWRRRDLTRDLVHGPWLRMGDMLREVEPGIYRHVGRADDLFKVDAQWVSPTEVEASLLSHPAVREAAVVGRTDERGLLRPCAYVVADDDADLAATLRRHVAHRLAPHMAPRWVIRREELPRLPSGKLDRRRLRRRG